ncbi:TIGR03085 family metal-binding protein [Aestuariimicrobium ganziense]|uniref:TIGR03085 family metal-binding protein n=1 Tax=Aestuariimicrobium ganziense TaxID=2773677 RepID=UPI001942FA45|nr:TIGR03085 family metal-binding protein [Aestuariimicrobium ganziense]
MNLAHDERATLADLFTTLGPDAPTLCEGWTTADLAAHLYVRENDPIAAGGIMIAPLAAHTERKMEQARRSRSWDDLVALIRRGPTGFSLFRVPGVDEAANAVEFFIHAEDIRRAQPGGASPRDLGAEVEDFFWRRLRLIGRAMFRSVDAGVVLERSDVEAEPLRLRPGSSTVTCIGRPSELLLLASGRADHAVVEVVGEPDVVARFRLSLSSL